MLSKQNTLQIRGGAIIMMVAYHLCGCPERYNEVHPEWYGSPITKALVLCVPIYLFLSGYGLQCGGAFGLEKLWKRLRKLYQTFWWVFIPFVSVGMFVGYYSLPSSVSDFLMNFWGLTYQYNAEWWFFCIYLGQLLGFLLLSRLNVRWYYYLLIMISIFGGSRFILNKAIDLNFWVEMFLIYLNIFMLGVFFSKFDVFKIVDSFLPKNKFWIMICGLVGVILSVVMRAYSPSVGIIELVSVPLFVWSINCFSDGLLILKSFFAFFGKHSTNLWLIHSFFIFYYLNHITFVCNSFIISFSIVMIQSLACSLILEYCKTKANFFVSLVKRHDEK